MRQSGRKIGASLNHYGDQPESDWAAFYRAHRDGLAAYARALSSNAADAQDLIQDVLVRMVRQGQPTTGARPLVFRAMRNLAIDRHRRRRLESETLPLIRLQFELPTDGADAASLEAMRRALEQLTDAQREVIVLRTYAGLTFEEVSEATARPIGTVASQYARGIEALRTILAPEKHYVRP